MIFFTPQVQKWKGEVELDPHRRAHLAHDPDLGTDPEPDPDLRPDPDQDLAWEVLISLILFKVLDINSYFSHYY